MVTEKSFHGCEKWVDLLEAVIQYYMNFSSLLGAIQLKLYINSFNWLHDYSPLCTAHCMCIFWKLHMWNAVLTEHRVPCCWNVDLGCQRCKNKELGKPK